MAGTVGIARAVVSETTSVQQRTRYIAILDACRYVGYGITPLFGYLLSKFQQYRSREHGIRFNDLTTPGLVLAVMYLLLLLWSRIGKINDGNAYWGTASCCCGARAHDTAQRLLAEEHHHRQQSASSMELLSTDQRPEGEPECAV